MLTRLQGLTEFSEISQGPGGKAHNGSGRFPSLDKMHAGMGHPGKWLLADAELGDDAFVTLGIVFLQIVQQTTPLADQHEKAPARTVVFLVRLEVLRQLANALTQQRDLYFRTSGIRCVRTVLVNEGLFLLSG
jgi:hypothetical protein